MIESKLTLTCAEIVDLVRFCGLRLVEEPNADEAETEITVQSWPEKGVRDDDGKTMLTPHNWIAYYEDYPEEGCVPLGSPNEKDVPCNNTAGSDCPEATCSAWREVPQAEFQDFILQYPRPLETDIARMCEPPMKTYNDFTLGNGPESIVAKVKLYDGSEYHEGKQPVYFLPNDKGETRQVGMFETMSSRPLQDAVTELLMRGLSGLEFGRVKN